MARRAPAIAATERWFSRLGRPFDATEVRLALGYLEGLGLQADPAIAVASGWRDAEAIMRDPQSAEGWWKSEEIERERLMRDMRQRIGAPLLLDALTSATEGFAESTYAGAIAACDGNEALAKVASGAALTAIHLRALALLANCGERHVFVQKYALFAAGRFPLGMRGPTFTFF